MFVGKSERLTVEIEVPSTINDTGDTGKRLADTASNLIFRRFCRCHASALNQPVQAEQSNV
tara:strand:+ start:42816 stop:42998 length:183 start_codon:yes stop_codon:yes gene_type:complete